MIFISINPVSVISRQPETGFLFLISPSTSAKDRSEKFTNYLTIPSLQEYLLIDSQKISVERYSRGKGRMWLYYHYLPGDVITLSSLDLEFPIEILYEGVVFDTE